MRSLPSLKTIGFYSLLPLFIMLLTACSHSNHLEELKRHVIEIRQEKISQQAKTVPHKKETRPLPIQEATPVAYHISTLRSPFEEKGALPPEKGDILNPLQAFPLNVLRFVGTLSEHHIIYGFILAPGNKIYQVKIGDMIGDHRGKITYIYLDHIEITEQQMEDNKYPTQHIETLRLKEPSG